MPEESISVAPSEDNGNVPLEAPSEPTVEPVVEPVQPAEPTIELFDLPDGRKVDAQTLATEFKQNFLPEFTRKSQELAQLKEKEPLPEPVKSPYADPEYVPQNYEEIIRTAEERVFRSIEQREADRIATQQAIETSVATQLDEVKKVDPTVNENQLFLHATKYNFRDLTVAHRNMKDMAELAKTVKQQTAQDIQKRNDPVSVSPGATGARPNRESFSSAVDFLRSLSN